MDGLKLADFRIAAIQDVNLAAGEPFSMEEIDKMRRAVRDRSPGVPSITRTAHPDWCLIVEKFLLTIDMMGDYCYNAGVGDGKKQGRQIEFWNRGGKKPKNARVKRMMDGKRGRK